MRKPAVLFLTAIILFVTSCAPLIKKENCSIRFEQIKKESAKQKDYRIRGNLFVHGIYLVFYGKLGKETKLSVRSPFGKKLFSISYQKDTICVSTGKEDRICGRELDVYWDYLNVRIPFDLKDLLTGRPVITDGARYVCNGDELIIFQNDSRLIYRGKRLERIVYRDFSADYFYEDGKIHKIQIKQDGKEIFRIYIRQLEAI
ncbi:hypothetical protein [Persephonella sp.]